MTNETFVTLQGWLGSDVTVRQAGDVPVAAFRVACTPRRFNRRTQAWSDGPTQWYSVNAWRGLAETCAQSLHRGDPVVVHGRLDVHRWVSKEGVEMTSLEIDASLVGHDLNLGVSQFTRSRRAESGDGDHARSEAA